MAIFSLSQTVASRSKGQSAVAAAAYRHAVRLTDERTGEVKDFSRKQGVLASWIQTPELAPAWMGDRAKLWNGVEAREDQSTRRGQAQLFYSVIVALPHELTSQQNEWLLRDFVKENITRRGMVADIAIHAPDGDGDQRNSHAHIMYTMRVVEGDSFGKKHIRGDSKGAQAAAQTADLNRLRERWSHHTNRQLERHGHAVRIDHRSHEARGIKVEPTQHVGVAATGMERRGVASERGGINAAIMERNGLRDELAQLDTQQRRLDRHLTRVEAIELDRRQRAEAERQGKEPRTTTQYAIDRLMELAAEQGAGSPQDGQHHNQAHGQGNDTQDEAQRAAAVKAEEEAFNRALAQAHAEEEEQRHRLRW